MNTREIVERIRSEFEIHFGTKHPVYEYFEQLEQSLSEDTEVLEKVKSAMLCLRTNYDSDGNNMCESDAYQYLYEAITKTKKGE